jgi:hypothetical protein
VATVVTLVLGMNYVITWDGLPRGPFNTWLAPSDLWGTYLASVHLVHGQLTPAYAAYPGILLLFAPAAALGSALNLEVGPNFAAFAAPTGWILMGPLELLVAAVPIFACDAVAERFGVGRAHRYVLALAEAAVLANVTIKWGHPEDALAVGLVIYAAFAASRGRWTAAGWLVGVAIAVQPLALLALPAIAATASDELRQMGRLLVRAVIPGVVVLGPALIADWGELSYWLRHQPNYPAFNHVTPFTSSSPVIVYRHFDAVAAGPTRTFALGVALLLGVLFCRHRPSLERLLFVIGLVFLARVVFESVLDSYYTWPVMAIALVLASRGGWPRLVGATAVALFATWFSNLAWVGVWPWWGIMVATLVVLLALAAPWPAARSQPTEPPADRLAPAGARPSAGVDADP